MDSGRINQNRIKIGECILAVRVCIELSVPCQNSCITGLARWETGFRNMKTPSSLLHATVQACTWVLMTFLTLNHQNERMRSEKLLLLLATLLQAFSTVWLSLCWNLHSWLASTSPSCVILEALTKSEWGALCSVSLATGGQIWKP